VMQPTKQDYLQTKKEWSWSYSSSVYLSRSNASLPATLHRLIEGIASCTCFTHTPTTCVTTQEHNHLLTNKEREPMILPNQIGTCQLEANLSLPCPD
jgi:hypothetical protein